jgi:hypothetical protein
VTDKLPKGEKFKSAKASEGSCSTTSTSAKWTLGQVEAAAIAPVTLCRHGRCQRGQDAEQHSNRERIQRGDDPEQRLQNGQRHRVMKVFHRGTGSDASPVLRLATIDPGLPDSEVVST